MITTVHEQYQRDGFFIQAEPVIPDDLVARAVQGMDDVRNGIYDTGEPPQESPWTPGEPLTRLCKIEMPQISNLAIRELISHPALGELAAEVTGAMMVQAWWVQLLIKPPSSATGATTANVGWHQDRQYWEAWEDGSELFTAWVALSDVTEDAGAMHFVPGSHRWGFLNQGDFFAQSHDQQKDAITVPEGAEWKEVPAVLAPGGVSFHHCLTFHASGPNCSDGPRRSFAIHLRTEKSKPRSNAREGLARFIDNTEYCPIIYGG